MIFKKLKAQLIIINAMKKELALYLNCFAKICCISYESKAKLKVEYVHIYQHMCNLICVNNLRKI